MPAVASLTERGRLLLEELPSWLRDDPDIRAVVHVFARESDRIEATALTVRDDLIPARAADRGLRWMEALLRLPIAPSGVSLEDRRTLVFDSLSRLLGDPSGRSWEDRVTAFVGGGWSYTEHDPVAGVIRIAVPYAPSELPAIERRIRDFTPAHLDLSISSSGGFVLDESALDSQELDPVV